MPSFTAIPWQGQASEWALLRRHTSEDLFGIQLCGAYPDTVARSIELVDRECEIDFIDINMGCPIDIVVNKGAGSSLLTKPTRMKNIIQSASATVDKPITVKVIIHDDYRVKIIVQKVIFLLPFNLPHTVMLFFIFVLNFMVMYCSK